MQVPLSGKTVKNLQTQKQIKQTLAKFKQITASDNQQQQTLITLQSQQKNIGNQVQMLIQAKTGHNQIATLSTIIETLKLANLTLNYSDNVKGAVILLQSAKQALAKQNNAKYLSLQQSITDNITELNALQMPNKTMLLTQISSLRNMITNIPFKVDTPAKTKITDKPAEHGSKWHHYWDKSLEKLQQVIIIKKQSGDIPKLLSPAMQQFTRQMLQFYLQQAQWAVLHTNQSIYDLSWQQMENNLQQYFSVDADASQSLLQQIKKLKNVNLNPTKPDIAKTINMAQDLFASATLPTQTNNKTQAE